MNPCWLNPCLNGGICTSNGLNYSCNCPQPAYGNNCQYYLNNLTNSTILNVNNMADLRNLLNLSLNKTWKLLYRSSRDGVLSSDFHSKCDNVSGTLTVIKTQNSNIFGGYTLQLTGLESATNQIQPHSYLVW